MGPNRSVGVTGLAYPMDPPRSVGEFLLQSITPTPPPEDFRAYYLDPETLLPLTDPAGNVCFHHQMLLCR